MAFVVLEGVDGAGKSELAERLVAYLTGRGVRPLLLREPGSTPLGERVRAILLDPDTGALDPISEALLFNACRAEMVKTEIRPALAAGRFVLLDRYADSTAAYQGGGGGANAAALDAMAAAATGGLSPDLVLLLDLSPAAAAARRRRVSDRMESRDPAYFDRVRARYLAIAASPARSSNFAVLDAALPPEEVFDAARIVLENRFPELRAKTGGAP